MAWLPGLRATSSAASAPVNFSRALPSTVMDSSARGDAAPGRLWLKAASTIGSPGLATASASSATSCLYCEAASA